MTPVPLPVGWLLTARLERLLFKAENTEEKNFWLNVQKYVFSLGSALQ